MTGEDNTIDFNIEELEFIHDLDEATIEDTPVNEGAVQEETDPNETGGLEENQVETSQEEEDNQIIEGAAEDGSPDGVGGSSTDEEGSGVEEETSPQLFQTFAETLAETGVLSSVDESSLKDIKSEDDLVALIQKQIAAQELNDLTDTQKAILTDMRDGVSADTAGQYKTAMSQLEGISDDMMKEDKQVRFDLIYQDFVAKGFTKEKATKFANHSFTAGDDLADALEAKQNLMAVVTSQYDITKQAEIDAAKASKDAIRDREVKLKDKILETEEVVKGLKVPENVRKEVYKEMSTTISTNPDTGVPENALQKYQRENPTDFGHKLYFLWKVTKGFEDYSYFANKRTTTKARKLETALRQSAHVSGGGNPSFSDDGDSHLLDIGSADDIVVPGQ